MKKFSVRLDKRTYGEPFNWCERELGPATLSMKSLSYNGALWSYMQGTFYFKHEQDAVLFALRWS